MTILEKPLENIELSDIAYLRDNKIFERKFLEYKWLLNIDSDKKEFLADISSFANLSGGLIIYGVREENGYPVEIPGIEVEDYDMLKQKIENIVRDLIEPRIKIDISAIPNDSKSLLILKVFRSWNPPHMVKLNGRFYSRNSAGKFPMDRDQIKGNLIENDSLTDRMLEIHRSRVQELEIKNLTTEKTPQILIKVIIKDLALNLK